MNPTGQIPTLTEGRFLVLGGYNVFLNYLCNHHQKIKEKLYQTQFKGEIDKHMLWFQSILKVASNRIVRQIVGPQAFGETAPSAEDIKRVNDEFYTKILPVLEELLGKREYICGDELTVADV